MDLIERDAALALLHGALASARRGAGLSVLVCGEAGIGKTSLVTRFAEQREGARDACRVLWGGCEALFSPRPLGPLHDMADALGAELRAALGVDGNRHALFAAMLADLQRSERPTLVVFEDLHWADAATLDLVKFLARRIARVPALLVLTWRDDEIGERHPLRHVLGDLPGEALVRVPLLPLSERGVETLARRQSRDAEGVFGATGGNPFFVTETLRAGGLPATVRDAVLTRAARQPPEVRALLELVAVAPGRIETAIVDAVLAPAAETVSQALASGLLGADGQSYAFRHELARIAVEQAMPRPRAAALNARVLACLEARTVAAAAAARLVHHASGAGDSAAVLRYAPDAATEAASHGAHLEAAALLATALAHASGWPPVERARLLERRAWHCHLTNQNESAIEARLSALAIWRALGDAQREGHTLRWLSRLNWYVGRNAAAQSYADQAVDLLQPLGTSPALAWALSNRAQLHMLTDESDEAIAWGQRALGLAADLGDDEIRSHALNNVGTVRYGLGDPEGRGLMEQSLRLALDRGFEEHAARAYANLTSTGVKMRDYAPAQRTMDEAATYFAIRDLDSWSNYVAAWQARLDFEQGRWDAAAEVSGRLVSRMSEASITRIPALVVLARTRLRRGDPGAATLLEEAAELAQETGEVQRLAPVAAALAEAQWLANDGTPPDARVLAALELALRRDDHRSIGELADWCRRLAASPGDEWAADGVSEDDARIRAVAALSRGPLAERGYALHWSGDWRAAAAAWAAVGCPVERALALLGGDAAAMREAVAAFEEMGLPRLARRAREHLRDAGVRVARGPRASTAANAAQLTTREQQILALLAQGLTNAEIAGRLVRSEKTVDHHVSAVLRKLNVRSRVEAAVMAGKLGIEPA